MVSVKNKTIFQMSANSEIDKIRAHPAEYLKIYYDNSAEILCEVIIFDKKFELKKVKYAISTIFFIFLNANFL